MIEVMAISLLIAVIVAGIVESIRANIKLIRVATLAGLFATRYSFENDIDIEARDQKDNTRKWVIISFGEVFNVHTKQFEYEPYSSERTEEFIRRTRFNTFDEAYKCYIKTVKPLVQKEVEEWIQKRKENLQQTKMKQSEPITNI